MGKKDTKGLLERKKDILRAKKEHEKQERLIKTMCSHQKHNGKLTVRPIGNRGEYVCDICGEEFNMNPISSQELSTAINTVHNALQQCRAFADAEEDEKIIKALGETDYNLTYVLNALYRKTISHYSKGGNKKKKNNNHREDEIGSYGNGSISLLNKR